MPMSGNHTVCFGFYMDPEIIGYIIAGRISLQEAARSRKLHCILRSSDRELLRDIIPLSSFDRSTFVLQAGIQLIRDLKFFVISEELSVRSYNQIPWSLG